MSGFDDFNFNDLDFSDPESQELLKKYEATAKFLDKISQMANAPQWEGISIPNLMQIRKFKRASEILGILFRNSSNVELDFSYPKSFVSYAGGLIRVHAEDAANIAPMVFESRESTMLVSELLELVSDIEVITTRSLQDGHVILEVNWNIDNVMLGDPEE